MNPTFDEVRKHFVGATEVRDYTGAIVKISKIKEIESLTGIIWDTASGATLWESRNGYSTILKGISKADQYFIEMLKEVRDNGQWDKDPRPKWSDGTPAHSKFITQKTFEYDISKGEFPITSLRPTAMRGGWYDMEAIYIKQTNIIEEMHPFIHHWWEPWAVGFQSRSGVRETSIGQTYGHTVKRYDLVNKLLRGLENNPFGRRHVMNLWQEQQMIEDPKALTPCAYETLWSVSEGFYNEYEIDLTLNQRSQDFIVTASINPMQYVQLGMAVCGHLTHHTGKKHTLRKFKYDVQNLHIYDRHIFAIDELLEREVQTDRFEISLPENKDFYNYKWEDFVIKGFKNIEPLSKKLEIAV